MVTNSAHGVRVRMASAAASTFMPFMYGRQERVVVAEDDLARVEHLDLAHDELRHRPLEGLAIDVRAPGYRQQCHIRDVAHAGSASSSPSWHSTGWNP